MLIKVIDNSGKTKISYFAKQVFIYEDIPGSQVPVDVIKFLQVAHTTGDLKGREKYDYRPNIRQVLPVAADVFF